MTTRVALIGAGRMGANHARVIGQLEDAQLIAVADPDPTVALRTKRLGVPVYGDHRELLEKERPTCVAVAVPTAAHRVVAEDCLNAGAHVLLEKPIALRSDDARALIETARRANRHLVIGHIERFNPAIRELRARLLRQQAGRVLQIIARRMSPYQPHIKDHGVTLDLGTHDLDVMRYLLGEEAVRVSAMSRRHIHSEHNDLMIGLIEFAGGAVGVLLTNWLTPAKIRDLIVLGQRGMFEVNYLPQELYFYENAVVPSRWESPADFLMGVGEGPLVRYPIERVEPLRAEWEAFLKLVVGSDGEGATAEEGLRTLILAEALERAAQTGRVVELDARPSLVSP